MDLNIIIGIIIAAASLVAFSSDIPIFLDTAYYETTLIAF